VRGLSPQSRTLLIGSMFLQVTPAAFFSLFNLFLESYKVSSQDIGLLNSYRYLVIFLFAVPIGLFSKKSINRQLLKSSGFLMPLSGMITLWGAQRGDFLVSSLGMVLMGFSMLVQQAFFVPYLLEGISEKIASRALAWHFALLSCSTLIVGGVCLLLEFIPHISTQVGPVLWSAVGLSFIGGWYFRSIRNESETMECNQQLIAKKEVWNKMFMLLIPQFFISFGAGISIPYLNLFFSEKWNLGHKEFMTLTFFSTVAVIIASLIAPRLAKMSDDRLVCYRTQYLSIICLVGLGFCTGSAGLIVATGLFIFRQPLMNMASPLLTKFTMEYIGKENRHLLGSLSQMTWGLGWFLSSVFYGYLRNQGFQWLEIFFLTGVSYLIAGFWYAEIMKIPVEAKLENSSL